MRTNRLLVGALAGAWLAAGCGLVSDDTANVDLSSLQKPFTIDAAAWNLNPTATAQVLNSTCDAAASPDPCTRMVIATGACKFAICTSTCNPETSRCQFTLRTELWRTVNLATDLPGLVAAADPDKDALDITLDDLTYEVPQNSFNVDLERLTLYLAPASVTNPFEGGVPVGTIRSIQAGEFSSRRSLDFFPDGKEQVRQRLSDYQVPFNLILGSTFTLEGNVPLPAGKLETVVGVEGRAGSD